MENMFIKLKMAFHKNDRLGEYRGNIKEKQSRRSSGIMLGWLVVSGSDKAWNLQDEFTPSHYDQYLLLSSWQII